VEDQLITDGTTSLFELLLKYPVPYTGEETRLRLFLADYATNRPIETATFSLAFKPSDVTIVQPPQMLSPGIYEMVAVFPDDTVYSMVATVTAAQRTDFVEVRNIYAGEAAERFLAEHATDAVTQTESEPGLAWWMIVLIAVGGLALVALVVRILSRRRRHTTSSGATVARDPELAQQGAGSIDTPEQTDTEDTQQDTTTQNAGRTSNG
jgi:hypothetical protein